MERDDGEENRARDSYHHTEWAPPAADNKSLLTIGFSLFLSFAPNVIGIQFVVDN